MMSDSVTKNPASAKPRRRASRVSIALPLLLFFAAMIEGADITAITLRPLKVLQIPYLSWMDYSHLLIAGGCAILWLVFRRKWPNAAAIFALLLCFVLISLIPNYAESKIAKVPMRHGTGSNDLKSMESRIGIPIFEQGSADGEVMLVAPANEQRLRAELARLHLLGHTAE